MNLNKIKLIARQQKRSLKSLATEIEMTEVGLIKAIDKETLRATALFKISKILKVPIETFVSENYIAEPVPNPNKENEYRDRLLKEQQDQIQLLKEYIAVLKKAKK